MGVGSSRRKGKKSTGWIRDTVLRFYTDDQLRADWEAIGPTDRVKIAASWVPKVVESKNETGMTVKFILGGVRDTKALKGQIVSQAALNPPDDTDDPEE